MNFGAGNGILGILVTVADIWAILNIAQSPVGNLRKAAWIGLVLLPVLGLVLWFLLGPRGGRSPSAGVERGESGV
jgi:hypothetical protein